MTTETRIKLEDLPLFKNRRPHEMLSQYERACQIRDQFAECMQNALNGNRCIMPMLCAYGEAQLTCAHLFVDYANFTGGGIPLTGAARSRIDKRLRGLGTQIYRATNCVSGALPGDVHVASLQKIAHFTGGPRKAAARPAKGKPRRSAPPKKSGGWLSRLFG